MVLREVMFPTGALPAELPRHRYGEAPGASSARQDASMSGRLLPVRPRTNASEVVARRTADDGVWLVNPGRLRLGTVAPDFANGRSARGQLHPPTRTEVASIWSVGR